MKETVAQLLKTSQTSCKWTMFSFSSLSSSRRGLMSWMNGMELICTGVSCDSGYSRSKSTTTSLTDRCWQCLRRKWMGSTESLLIRTDSGHLDTRYLHTSLEWLLRTNEWHAIYNGVHPSLSLPNMLLGHLSAINLNRSGSHPAPNRIAWRGVYPRRSLESVP